MAACGRRISAAARRIHIALKSLIWKQEQSAISPVAPASPSSKAPSRTSARKKRTTKPRAKLCHVTGKVCRKEKAAKETAARRSNAYLKLRAYKCFYCFFWHLTHSKNKLTLH